MSDFTIEQLEALKEGAPVMHRSSKGAGDRKTHGVRADNGMLRALVGYGPDGGAAYKDAELFAAAPALVDALIAEKRENQRMRKELEKAREIFRDDTYPGSKGVVVRITRILEATDE